MIKIAVDGPAGAGKSSLARAVAERLGYIYVDTGALYRTIGLYMDEHDIDPHDAEAVARALPDISVEMIHQGGEQTVLLNGRNVGDDIRTPKISTYASAVSAIPAVRAFLLNLQREIGDRQNVVMDGRDIGTVIFPDADVKLFLTASPECRAKRRVLELCARGRQVTYEEVLKDMQERDANDRTRAIAPAVAAPDAIVLDNTNLNERETVDAAVAIIEGKLLSRQ